MAGSLPHPASIPDPRPPPGVAQGSPAPSSRCPKQHKSSTLPLPSMQHTCPPRRSPSPKKQSHQRLSVGDAASYIRFLKKQKAIKKAISINPPPPPTPTPPLQGHRTSDRHSRTHPSSLPRDPRGRVPDCRRTCSPSRVVQTVLGMLFLKNLFDLTGMEAQEEDPFQTSLGTIPSRWPPVDSPPNRFQRHPQSPYVPSTMVDLGP